jgi:hypothetical protein
MIAVVTMFVAFNAARMPAAWLILAPGSQAYLKDDGLGADGTTVCVTRRAYVSFENGQPSKLCRVLMHGRLVHVVRIAGSNDLNGTITPLVEIATKRARLGFTDASFLRPLVPIGTTLEARSFGDFPTLMWPDPRAAKDVNAPGYGQSIFGSPPMWTVLPSGTLVRVLRQLPYVRQADLNVIVLGGALNGKLGWTADLFVPHTDLPSDEFDFSVTPGNSGIDSSRE